QCCVAIFVLLFLTDYWYIAALYAGWLHLDRETPRSGGRRSAWVRSWLVWHYFRDYFPITLVKTEDLNPKHNYLFGFHPHGVLVAGAFGNFCTEATGFSHLFPGLTSYLLMLPFWFKVPFFREYIMCGGLVSSEKQSANYILSQEGGGNVAVVAVGGAPESLDARPGALKLRVLGRKGFIKLALKTGAHLVPVFSFGENELFNQVENPPGSRLRVIQDKLQKVMGLALPLFHARGIFQYSFGLVPFRNPVYTVVGKPIAVQQNVSPSREDIEKLHGEYLEQLVALFEENKTIYGIAECNHLELV
ncbi:2-acylglycerol O-acyltransferase 1, partial [Rhincodon typus]|uniref:2-acylglycerol O-acyltransferase 1 n=1 Tax=Rhincodon typus TaxID=259920 RepID=UPI0020309D51